MYCSMRSQTKCDAWGLLLSSVGRPGHVTEALVTRGCWGKRADDMRIVLQARHGHSHLAAWAGMGSWVRLGSWNVVKGASNTAPSAVLRWLTTCHSAEGRWLFCARTPNVHWIQEGATWTEEVTLGRPLGGGTACMAEHGGMQRMGGGLMISGCHCPGA